MNDESDHYTPGKCNIGKDELNKRKKELVVSVLTTAILTASVFYFYDYYLLWLLLFASSAFAMLMYLQIRNHFCVVFGFFSRYNFGKVGSLQKINDPEARIPDRKKVLVISLQTLLFSFIYTGLTYLLAGNFHF